MGPKQIDCFKLNMPYWKFLAIWPRNELPFYYKHYAKTFLILFVIAYDILLTLNFFFLPRQLDIFIEELLFYFTALAILSKALTFYFMRDKIVLILDTLECETFQPDAGNASKILKKAKRFIKRYWKIVAVVNYLANLFHILPPIITHLFVPFELKLPVSSYSFIPENIKNMFIYPLYFYQSIGMHFHMLYNVTIDTFFNGLMILTITQLEILNYKLRHVTDYSEFMTGNDAENVIERENFLKSELNKCVIHFAEIDKFCKLIEDVFSLTLFTQIAMSSCIICVSMFRFTMPANSSYYFFLINYVIAMVAEIMVPCWFGSRLMESSSALSIAAYSCDWIARTPAFKSNLRLLVERMNKSLSVTGWKMFPLSLATFTGIMKTAYSFFTLLRHMQTRES